MIESELASDRANRVALTLASERYRAQLAPFVKGSSTRLEYVRDQLTDILSEVCRETGADFEYVSSRLEDHLAAAVLVKDHAKREKLEVKEDSWPKNVKDIVDTGDIHKTTLEYTGEVEGAGDEEARTPDAKVDLSKDTQKGTYPSERKQGSEEKCECGHSIDSHDDDGCNECNCPAYYYDTTQEKDSCFRCGNELHEKVAAVTPVCNACTEELRKTVSNCGGECDGDCKCGKKKTKEGDDGYLKDDEAEDKVSSIEKTAETFSYECGPAGIHMQSVSEVVNNGYSFSMQTQPVGDLPAMSLSFPGDSPMQLMKWLVAHKRAGVPVEGEMVTIDTDNPQEITAILDAAGRKGGGGGRPPLAANVKEADLYGNGLSQQTQPATIDLGQNSISPVNDANMPYVCEICGRQGNQQEITEHVNQDHADVLERQRQQIQNNPGTAVGPTLASDKTAETADLDEQAVVDPLPQAPADQFDDMVQDLANRAAAIQFSSLDEADLNALAESLGLTKDDIQGQLQTVAVFGNYTGLNGQLVESAPEVPPGFTEVQASIKATAHEALIPTNIVISKVAESMNMEQDLAYQMVKDKYGGVDLPDKYHASVEGTYHFYLPAQLAGNASQDVAAEQGDIGPTAYAPSGGQAPPVPTP